MKVEHKINRKKTKKSWVTLSQQQLQQNKLHKLVEAKRVNFFSQSPPDRIVCRKITILRLLLNSVTYCSMLQEEKKYTFERILWQDESAYFYTTRAMSLLSGSFARLPSQRLLWMVKASIVTVKLFVWILVNFLPPELYLKNMERCRISLISLVAVWWSEKRHKTDSNGDIMGIDSHL